MKGNVGFIDIKDFPCEEISMHFYVALIYDKNPS